jgi:hypothetical protein
MLQRDNRSATIRENPIRVIPERKDVMNTHSDIKLTDQLERDLIERELGAQSMGFGNDVKRVIGAIQNVFTRLQAEARKAKVAYANG